MNYTVFEPAHYNIYHCRSYRSAEVMADICRGIIVSNDAPMYHDLLTQYRKWQLSTPTAKN